MTKTLHAAEAGKLQTCIQEGRREGCLHPARRHAALMEQHDQLGVMFPLSEELGAQIGHSVGSLAPHCLLRGLLTLHIA